MEANKQNASAGNKVPWVPERLRMHAKNIRELDIRFINSKEVPKRLRSVVKFWTRQFDGIEIISATFPTKKGRECKTATRFSEELKRCFEETQELYQTSRVWGLDRGHVFFWRVDGLFVAKREVK